MAMEEPNSRLVSLVSKVALDFLMSASSCNHTEVKGHKMEVKGHRMKVTCIHSEMFSLKRMASESGCRSHSAWYLSHSLT